MLAWNTIHNHLPSDPDEHLHQITRCMNWHFNDTFRRTSKHIHTRQHICEMCVCVCVFAIVSKWVSHRVASLLRSNKTRAKPANEIEYAAPQYKLKTQHNHKRNFELPQRTQLLATILLRTEKPTMTTDVTNTI